MASIQALRGTSVTVTETFSNEDGPIDLDSGVPTVVAKFPDGTALTPAPVASGAWSGRTTGQYRIVLDPQAEVTYLDPITWTGTIGGKTQTLYSRVEWVGGLLFNLSDLRGLKVGNGYPFASDTTWPVAKLMEARVAVAEELRTILGFHPVPRFCRETKDGDGRASIVLTDPGLKAHRDGLLSVTIDGFAKTVTDYTLKPSGILLATSGYRASGYFPDGIANVTVEYVSGWPHVVGEGRLWSLVWAAKYLDPSGFSNAQTITTPDGVTMSYEPSEVGRSGFQRWTGVRDLDRWLNRHAGGGVAVA